MVILANRIKQYRERTGMSMEEFARKIGKSRATAYRYESGDIKKITANTLKKIADVLEVDMNVLCGADINEVRKAFESESDRYIRSLIQLIADLDTHDLIQVTNLVEYILELKGKYTVPRTNLKRVKVNIPNPMKKGHYVVREIEKR